MEQELSKNAQSIQDFLESRKLSCEVMELSSSTRSALDAANSLGCELNQIVKSLIFKTLQTEKPVLILAAGSNRVDEKVIESHLNEKISKADAKFTKKVTGFSIGGIPPIVHSTPIEHLFIDKDLLQFEWIWAAAGTPHAVFKIRSQDLVSITNGHTLQIN